MMDKLQDIDEVIAYLKEGDIVTSTGRDRFAYKDNRVYRFDEGTHFGLDIKDFKELYNKTDFYLYEETVEVDEEKDEAYYRYYRK